MESISSAASSSRRPASFFTHANALLRKNLTFQRVINNELNKDKFQCGCQGGICGLQYSTLDQADTCPISSPPQWSALVQVPRPQYRAVRTDFSPSADLPDESCRASQSCPAAVLLTGGNRSLAQILAQSLFPSSSSPLDFSDYPSSLSNVILMIGLITPTSGTAYVQGVDIRTNMDEIYTSMGVCPQHE
ncbi:hypothetical protein BHE74_00028859 [Ensete ventricosum]|uniref:Uncharacterized protein n=1 Tax=Ensete ventricosum TaxID=4639 RepID=A0A427AE03_ENSVE|nr:hypothetical protein B296_00024909 [Ensete ventricosum]RWV86921.1 hypothetical protein GW17_00051135 [Ensete ventricosum]RWW63940.1 hypothetical protein BHE74_00028859 [Ensete ventricosum]